GVDSVEVADGDAGPPVVGAGCDLDDVVGRCGVEQVVVTFSTAPDEVLLRVVNRAEQRGLAVAIVPRLFEKVPERLSIDHLGGLPLLTARPANPRSLQFAVKYGLDRVLALLGLVVAAPVLLAAVLAIRLSIGSPGLFRQVLIGR